MKILEREIGSITYAANQTRTLQLPRNYAYRSLSLELRANISRDPGTAGQAKDSAPAQLVKNIVIRANGRDVIKNYDMETLHRLCEMRHHTRPYIYAEDFSGFGVKSGILINVAAQIDFAMWDAIRPIDSLLDSAGLATLELIITWGAGGDLMNDAFNGASVAVNSATLYVASVEEIGVPAGTPFMVNKEYMIRSQVNAASASHQIILPVSNLYRSFVIKTHSDGNLVDTILAFPKTIQIKSGTEVFKNRIAGSLQSDNRLEKELQIPERMGSGSALSHRLQELTMEGYYLLEFVKDGRLTESLDTSRLSSLELILDVANPGTDDFIDVYPVELLQPARIA